MEREDFIRDFKAIVDKEQELYDLYSRLAEEVEDEGLKKLFGWIAHEEYSHLCIITDKYQRFVSQDTDQ